MDGRTIPATQQRRKRLRSEGDVPRSSELSSAIIFLALVALASVSVTASIHWFEEFTRMVWQTNSSELAEVTTLQRLMTTVTAKLAVGFGSAAGLTLLMVFGLNYLHAGRLSLGKRGGGVAIGAGLMRFFSFDSLLTFWVSVFKIIALSCAVYLVAKSDLENIFTFSTNLQQQSMREIVYVLSAIIFKCCFASACVLLFFSGLDYIREWLRYENRIRMTPDELRDEIREIETDPQIIRRRSNSRNRSA